MIRLNRLVYLVLVVSCGAVQVYGSSLDIDAIVGSNTSAVQSPKVTKELDKVEAYKVCKAAIDKTNGFKNKTSVVSNKLALKISSKDKSLTGDYGTEVSAEVKQRDSTKALATVVTVNNKKEKAKDIVYHSGAYLYCNSWVYDTHDTSDGSYVVINPKTKRGTVKKNVDAGYDLVDQYKEKLTDAYKAEGKEISGSDVQEQVSGIFGSWCELVDFNIYDIKSLKGTEGVSYAFELNPETLKGGDLEQFNLESGNYKGTVSLELSLDKKGYITKATYRCNISTDIKNYKARDSIKYAGVPDGTVITLTRSITTQVSKLGKTVIDYRASISGYEELTGERILNKLNII